MMKSRLVARGDLSNIFNRSDSPTAEKEGMFLVFSFASSRKLIIKVGDLDHGYFQGEKLSKPLILKQPKSGLPDPKIQPDDRLLAFVPIYGTRDAGRGLWRRIRRVLLENNFTENFILSATYSYSRDGVVLALIAIHVDDILWANESELDSLFESIFDQLVLGKQQQKEFRFCGVEVKQNKDFSIVVTCEQTTRKLEVINLTKARQREVEEMATPEEKQELWSVVGSLMWITRCCRPGIAYRVSSLQSACHNPMIGDIVEANKVVKHVLEDPKAGLTYRPGLEWPTQPGEQLRICVAAVSDASHGNEEVYIDEWEIREPFRSQGAKQVFLASTALIDQAEGQVHLLSFASTIQPRVVNSTIKAETYQLSLVVEAADLIRAAIADARGRLDDRQWETSAASSMKSVWFTDCKSCFDTLQKPIAKTVDKRLGIELASLRQHLWRDSGSHIPDPDVGRCMHLTVQRGIAGNIPRSAS